MSTHGSGSPPSSPGCGCAPAVPSQPVPLPPKCGPCEEGSGDRAPSAPTPRLGPPEHARLQAVWQLAQAVLDRVSSACLARLDAHGARYGSGQPASASPPAGSGSFDDNRLLEQLTQQWNVAAPYRTGASSPPLALGGPLRAQLQDVKEAWSLLDEAGAPTNASSQSALCLLLAADALCGMSPEDVAAMCRQVGLTS